MRTSSRMVYKIVQTQNDNKSLIPRLIVGLVFLSEGIQKYIVPQLVGVGRFERIGFENPEFLAYFVATFEVICGFLLLAGFLIRLWSVPLLSIMFTALYTTKIPILIEDGFWGMAHAARTDFAMTMLLIYLMIFGAGKYSFDGLILNRLKKDE